MRRIPAKVAKVERRREEAKRKGPDAERHVEATVAGEALKALRLLRFGALAGRSRRDRFSWILLAATPAVQWNDLFLADGRLAYRTRVPVAVHPLVNAGPAEQVAAHADDRVLGRIETDVALKHRVVLLLLVVIVGVLQVDLGLAGRRRSGFGAARGRVGGR